MSGFSGTWLDLREPADRAARSEALARRFAAALAPAEKPLRLLDLGAGNGSNFRVLAPLIAGDQHWTLIDDDPALLAAQADAIGRWARDRGLPAEAGAAGIAVRGPSGCWTAASMRHDLTHALPDVAAGAVTMAAFVDLVSANWLEGFATWLRQRRIPLLAVLTVDGRREWTPPAAEDQILARAFAAHQRRDKGFGPALGGDAPMALAAALENAGFAVSTAPSDWRLGPEEGALLAELIAGEAGAAADAAPDKIAAIARWRERRERELAAGELGLVVGHRDVLALIC